MSTNPAMALFLGETLVDYQDYQDEFDETELDVEIQEIIADQLGEPDWFDPATAEIADRLIDRDLPMPDGWKIDVATGLPMELRTGFVMGRECYGYYQSGWTSAAIAWQEQNPS